MRRQRRASPTGFQQCRRGPAINRKLAEGSIPQAAEKLRSSGGRTLAEFEATLAPFIGAKPAELHGENDNDGPS